MDGLVTAVAIHELVGLVRRSADETRLPCFHSKEFVFYLHRRVKLHLLRLIPDSVTVDNLAADDIAELDHIESRSTNRATVRALHPRLETCIVQVMLAR